MTSEECHGSVDLSSVKQVLVHLLTPFFEATADSVTFRI